jgi:hypothetical protein
MKSKINSKLCEIGGFDPEEWDFPAKPKWMRQRTYERMDRCFNAQEDKLDRHIELAAARLLKSGF